MNATKWFIDDSTDLFKSEDGFLIRWACAFFGPCEKLEELCEAELLDQCRQLLTTPGTATELATVDSALGDGFTFELEPAEECMGLGDGCTCESCTQQIVDAVGDHG